MYFKQTTPESTKIHNFMKHYNHHQEEQQHQQQQRNYGTN